ncbi:signal peptide peptidase SppA, partial [bacterium]
MHREPSFLDRLVRTTLVNLVSFIVFIAVIGGIAYFALNKDTKIEDGTWLVLDLYGDLHEYHTPSGPLGPLMGGDELTLQDMLDNLGKAAMDDRIAGVIFKMSSSNSAGMAKLQELRQAVDKVQAVGKPVYAWADALTARTFYLASGCDSVLMPDGGYFDFRGISVQLPYIRGVLDKLGIKPHLHKIKDYKAAAEVVMDKQMSDAVKENVRWRYGEIWEEVLNTLAAERGLDRAQLVEAMEYAEFTTREAVTAGLIDETVYMQDLAERLKGEKDDRLKTVSHGAYTDVSWEDAGLKTGDTVAVVHAQGNIGGRENRVDPMMGIMMGHESIVRELQRCRYDEDVKAVVFRVDSGGGESLASDLMSHEVDKLSQVKPVVVSMVDVAASGGYYIAYKGTKIMAGPMTVTGSIGSINGFFNMKGFYDKIGFTKDGISFGPNADLGSDMRDPTDEEWQRHSEAHYITFNEWLQDVADRRGMTFEHAQTLAHGRTWTGTQALDNGLIDAVGNLDDAIALAMELAE